MDEIDYYKTLIICLPENSASCARGQFTTVNFILYVIGLRSKWTYKFLLPKLMERYSVILLAGIAQSV
jgi:hypothetical protein